MLHGTNIHEKTIVTHDERTGLPEDRMKEIEDLSKRGAEREERQRLRKLGITPEPMPAIV